MSNAHRKNKNLSVQKIKPFSYRPAKHIAPRFYDVVEVSKRSKASVLHESLDKTIPVLETQYAPELAALKRTRKQQLKEAA